MRSFFSCKEMFMSHVIEFSWICHMFIKHLVLNWIALVEAPEYNIYIYTPFWYACMFPILADFLRPPWPPFGRNTFEFSIFFLGSQVVNLYSRFVPNRWCGILNLSRWYETPLEAVSLRCHVWCPPNFRSTQRDSEEFLELFDGDQFP